MSSRKYLKNTALLVGCWLFFGSSVLAQTSPIQQLEAPFYDPNSGATTCSSDNGATDLKGNDNAQKAFNYFVSKGLTDTQSAGIVGNLYEESGGVNPKSNQNGGGPGRGIAQWGVGQRWDTIPNDNVLDFAAQQNKDPYDLGLQLDFVWYEMTNVSGFTKVLTEIKGSTTLKEAVDYFMTDYEAPGIPREDVRLADAEMILNAYGGGVSGGPIDVGGSICNEPTANCSDQSQATDLSQVRIGPALSQVRTSVVCVAKQELALWQSQPGYPWSGENTYSETGYIKYTNGSCNGPPCEEWCADFVSWVYDQVRYPLQPDPDWRIAYVPNIQSVGEQENNFHWHSSGSGYVPKPGDIAIHGPNHTNIFTSFSNGVAQYIGGDQVNGPYPGGSVVSIETGNGFYDNGITGYVSPD